MADPQQQAIVQRMIDAGEPESNIALVIQHFKTQAPATPAPAPPSTFARVLSGARDLGTGVLKGAAHTALDLGQEAGNLPNLFNPVAGNLKTAVDTAYAKPGLSAAAFPAAREATAHSNNMQRAGGVAETLAEMAVPVTEGAQVAGRLIPTAAKAGAKLESVLQAAKDVPIDISSPGNVALRIQQLADRGGSMPMVVRKMLGRMTDPAQPPPNYAEGHDFYSNISRLSADEYNRLAGPVKREVANLRATLGQSLADAADTVGQGQNYAQGMSQYARAMKLRDLASAAAPQIAKGAAYGAGVGGAGLAATQLIKKLLE